MREKMRAQLIQNPLLGAIENNLRGEFCQRPTKGILEMRPGNSVGTELERRNARPAILLKRNGIFLFGISVKTSLKQRNS